MTYVVANKPGEEPSIVKVDNYLEAEKVVKTISDQLKVVLNTEHLVVTKKENTTTVKWDGNVMVALSIYEDDEIDLSPTNG